MVLGRVGDDVRAVTGIEYADREHRWLVRYIDLAALDRLQPEHDL